MVVTAESVGTYLTYEGELFWVAGREGSVVLLENCVTDECGGP